MNSVQKMAKNLGYSTIGQIVVWILGFLFVIYLARVLGAAGYGQYSFAMAFTTLFTIFADFGMNQYLIREIARDKSLYGDYVSNIFTIKIILAVITFGLIVLTINLMGYPENVKNLVYIFGIFIILSSYVATMIAIFQSFERMDFASFITIVEKIIIIAIGVIILTYGYGVIGLAYTYILAGIIGMLIGLCLLIVKIDMKLGKIKLSLWKKIFYHSVPFGLNGLFAVFYFQIDSVLLSFLKNDVAVGLYNAAYNPILALGGMSTNIFMPVIYPMMSRYFTSSEDALTKITELSAKYLIILGLPTAIGCFILGDRFITLFYGTQYAGSIIAFQILAFFIPIRLLNSLTGTLLSSINKQTLRMIGVLAGAVFNILINLILIPLYSYIGASIATVLTEVLLYVLFVFFINRYHSRINTEQYILKPLIASVVMGIILLYLKGFNIITHSLLINLIILVIIGTTVYFICLICLRTFTDQDKYIFKQLIKRFESK